MSTCKKGNLLLKALGSESRLIILRDLSRHGESTSYAIAKRTWLDRSLIKKHTDILYACNLLEKRKNVLSTGPQALVIEYRLNLAHPTMRKLRDLLDTAQEEHALAQFGVGA